MRLPHLRLLLALVALYVVGGYVWIWYAAQTVQEARRQTARYHMEAERMTLRARCVILFKNYSPFSSSLKPQTSKRNISFSIFASECWCYSRPFTPKQAKQHKKKTQLLWLRYADESAQTWVLGESDFRIFQPPSFLSSPYYAPVPPLLTMLTTTIFPTTSFPASESHAVTVHK